MSLRGQLRDGSLSYSPFSGVNERRDKAQKKRGDALERRRLKRLDEEAVRELESAAQAKIVERLENIILARENMAQATKLMERECQSERVKVRPPSGLLVVRVRPIGHRG